VREAVDVARHPDNGLSSVTEKVEEVQDSFEHAQVHVSQFHIVVEFHCSVGLSSVCASYHEGGTPFMPPPLRHAALKANLARWYSC
jgi:predicted GNAT family N-acyltransferase